MIRLTALFLALFAWSLSGASAAPPRIALVRVTDIYAGLPSTKSRIKAFDGERKEIMNDRRAEQIRSLVNDLQQMQADLQKKNAPDTRSDALQEYNDKAATIKSLQDEFEKFRGERELEINRKVVAFMRQTFERIITEARNVAVTKGFDWVIDSSGNTNTGLPVLLYSKDAPDITADVVAVLAKSEPAETPVSADSATDTPPNGVSPPAAPQPAPATPPTR